MFYWFHSKPRSLPGGAATTARLENDLGLLFSTLANPLGRPPARKWGEAASGPAVAAVGRRARPGRLAGGLIAGLAAVVLTAAGYAAVTNSSLADRVFANFGSTAEQAGVYPIGISETSDGVTVTVDHVVFDREPVEELSRPNGPMVSYVPVMVQFTVTGLPTDARYSIDETVTSGGQALRRAGAVGLGGGTYSEILKRELPPGTQQLLAAYDTTGLSPESGPLLLHLEVTVTPRGDRSNQSGDSSNPLATPVSGPSGTPIRFVFDFEVPMRSAPN